MDFRTYSDPQSLYMNQTRVLSHCYVAQNTFQKMKGLLGTKTLSPEEGLLLPQCQSVHTFFMRYPIDICFLNRQLWVVRLIPHLKPWQMTGWNWRAYYTLETMSGWTQKHHLRVGDQLRLGSGETA